MWHIFAYYEHLPHILARILTTFAYAFFHIFAPATITIVYYAKMAVIQICT